MQSDILKAQAGVVVTASHNPPEYNGFKAYLADGGQLVAPDDAKIIASIIMFLIGTKFLS